MKQAEIKKEIFEKLFSTTNGYLISTQARRRLGTDDKTLTYGEVKFESFKKILAAVSPKKGEVFYDLGSGTGKAVILASLFGDFSKIVGVEILKDLVKTAKQILKEYKKLLKKYLPEKLEQKIEFINENFLNLDLSEADIVFAHSTCFDDETMKRLSIKLESLKPGSRVITVSQGISSPAFKQIKKELVELSWGQGTVFFYIKS